MRAMHHIALKDLTILFRSPASLFWLFGFPLMIGLFFGAMFGDRRGGIEPLPVGIVDEDLTDASRAFAEQLKESPALHLRPLAREEAREAVRQGKLVAFLIFEKGYGQAGSLSGGKPPTVIVEADPARKAELGYLQGLLMGTAFALLQERLGAHQIVQPLRVEVRQVETPGIGPRTSYEITFPQAVMWGLFSAVSSFAIGMVEERRRGTLLRLRLSPLVRWQILAGKGLACMLAVAIVTAVILLVGWLVFGVRFTDPLALAAVIFCTAVCFTGIAMLLGNLGRSAQAVGGLTAGVFLPMQMLGGGMVPLLVMPAWMQVVSNFSPVKWSILALEGAIWRGFSWAEMLLPCSILLGVGTVSFLLGVWFLARHEV